MEYVLYSGIKAGVKRLALFHHEPTRSDGEFDTLERVLKKRAAKITAHPIEIFFAREGLELSL
jgi:phosphoribosyl 1,2-cyclic phosphodiesterase